MKEKPKYPSEEFCDEILKLRPVDSAWHEWFTVRGAVIAIEFERERRRGEREGDDGDPPWKHHL